MKNLREFYGDTIIDKNDYNELDVQYKLELKYYKIHNLADNGIEKNYGIEVMKKEFNKNTIKEESEIFFNIANSEEQVDMILNVLSKNKVTPIGVLDVLDDIYKNGDE